MWCAVKTVEFEFTQIFYWFYSAVLRRPLCGQEGQCPAHHIHSQVAKRIANELPNKPNITFSGLRK